jgi:hypothetical protein
VVLEQRLLTDFLWYVRVAMVLALMDLMSHNLIVLSCDPVMTWASATKI